MAERATDTARGVTTLLKAWRRGDACARDELAPLVYAELRRRAAAYLQGERRDHTLQPTALVHEAYVRLLGQRVVWRNRAHFFGIASQMMRRVLIDHARARLAAKRPRGEWRISVAEHHAVAPPPDCEVLLLDRVLRELAVIDARQAQIVEMRYFGGLTDSEIAEVLGVSRSTITREWQSGRAWMYRRLTKGARASS